MLKKNKYSKTKDYLFLYFYHYTVFIIIQFLSLYSFYHYTFFIIIQFLSLYIFYHYTFFIIIQFLSLYSFIIFLLCHNTWRNIHRNQFLKHQLTRIRQFNIIKVSPIITCLTLMYMRLIIIRRNHSTTFTNIHTKCI